MRAGSTPWGVTLCFHRARKTAQGGAVSFGCTAKLTLPQCLWKIHCAVFDAKNFQSHFREAVENQIIFKIIHAPRADVLQIPAAKFSQPAFQRLQRQVFNCAINRFEKPERGFGIVFAMYWK
jgi:hypothetical protein